jgi:hypothetical protein
MSVLSKEMLNEGIERCVYDSSNILASEYNEKCGELKIIFSNGSQYLYEDIAPVLYVWFREDESQGKFFNKEIKKASFNFKKLDNVKIEEFVEIKTNKLTEVKDISLNTEVLIENNIIKNKE